MNKIWFTADTHFGHTSIIKYCNRPFKDINHMDEVLIQNWNVRINPEEIVYHLGDFAWRNIGKYIERLNGNIHLIRGSHDKQIGNFSHYFVTVTDLTSIVINGNRIVLCHYAMRVWQASHFNSWQLYGHSHGRLKPVGKQLDVGVDNNNFMPLSYEEIEKIMKLQSDNINYVWKVKNDARKETTIRPSI